VLLGSLEHILFRLELALSTVQQTTDILKRKHKSKYYPDHKTYAHTGQTRLPKMNCHSMSQMADYLVAIVGISVLQDFFNLLPVLRRALNFPEV
jgi:hypothetical protein